MESYYRRYRENGFRFSDEVLTNYALSLATKPFVILSGISGTGKSKIAQLFEIPTDDGDDGRDEPEGEAPAEGGDRGYVTMNLSANLLNGGDRANFRYNDVALVLSPADAADIDASRQRHIENNLGANNFTDFYEVTIDTGDTDEPHITIVVYCQRAISPLFRIRFRSRRGEEPFWDSLDFFRRNYTAGDVVRFERVGDRHLRIVATDGEAKATAQADREAEIRSLNTRCFVAVRSNWVDSTELVGYYNQLTEKYQMTKVLRFLLQASEYVEVPHFLILDEMNLSKVEHYFSDFLSCMESRRVVDGEIDQESIVLHIGKGVLETNDDYYEEIAPEIEVPINLFITGTVNVDDSTQPISPKVLDRANVIEFNEVHLGDINGGGLKLKAFPDFSSPRFPSVDQLDEIPDFVKNTLSQLLEVLRPQNTHFGYRTIAEVASFVENAIMCLDTGPEESAKNALDVQLLQRVLPKFNGSAAKLEHSLRALIHCLSRSEINLEDFGRREVVNLDVTDEKLDFPRSLSKAKQMYLKMNEQGFVNFIE